MSHGEDWQVTPFDSVVPSVGSGNANSATARLGVRFPTRHFRI